VWTAARTMRRPSRPSAHLARPRAPSCHVTPDVAPDQLSRSRGRPGPPGAVVVARPTRWEPVSRRRDLHVACQTSTASGRWPLPVSRASTATASRRPLPGHRDRDGVRTAAGPPATTPPRPAGSCTAMTSPAGARSTSPATPTSRSSWPTDDRWRLQPVRSTRGRAEPVAEPGLSGRRAPAGHSELSCRRPGTSARRMSGPPMGCGSTRSPLGI
jgi:hypothetical protein